MLLLLISTSFSHSAFNIKERSKNFKSIPKKNSKDNNNEISFSLKDDVLTISCNGYMKNYTDSPWSLLRFKTVVFEGNILSIGDYAFEHCDELTNITIPSSVITIGVCVFNNCPNLQSINVETGNSKFVSIDGVLFSHSQNEIICFPAGKGTTYEIPYGTTIIGNSAFYYCNKLENITIPNGVTIIGAYAFYSCFSLTSITIPSSVLYIDDYAF